jgi:hypothetical protein
VTPEQREYGPGWATCCRCGLTARDVAGECLDPARCRRVIRGEPLGGPPLELLPAELRFDLDLAERNAVVLAVKRWRARKARHGEPADVETSHGGPVRLRSEGTSAGFLRLPRC